jgi:hypothetical protein
VLEEFYFMSKASREVRTIRCARACGRQQLLDGHVALPARIPRVVNGAGIAGAQDRGYAVGAM